MGADVPFNVVSVDDRSIVLCAQQRTASFLSKEYFFDESHEIRTSFGGCNWIYVERHARIAFNPFPEETPTIDQIRRVP